MVTTIDMNRLFLFYVGFNCVAASTPQLPILAIQLDAPQTQLPQDMMQGRSLPRHCMFQVLAWNCAPRPYAVPRRGWALLKSAGVLCS